MPPIPQSTLVGTSSPTPAGDAAAEIQNVPYAGYMETHLNHDNVNPTTFDFHRFVLLFGHGFGDRIRFWSELEFEHAFVEGREVTVLFCLLSSRLPAVTLIQNLPLHTGVVSRRQ